MWKYRIWLNILTNIVTSETQFKHSKSLNVIFFFFPKTDCAKEEWLYEFGINCLPHVDIFKGRHKKKIW